MNVNGLVRINDNLYEIPADYKPGMNVPARIYGTENLIRNMDDAVLSQITNVATLPGIIKYALCMPDGHSGYGFPIGGTAAVDPEKGVISPGGIGFDINCGVRLIATSLTFEEVKPELGRLVDSLFKSIPAGVGAGGIVSLKGSSFDDAMINGAQWAVRNGYGAERDCEYMEERGKISGADPSAVSVKARERGACQAGSLGSGNHYLEIQVVKRENVFDKERAEKFGLNMDNQIVIMIHSGSRGFGHQVATDYLYDFVSLQKKFGYALPDRELACAPFYSEAGQKYFGAMNCAINIAFLNRQLMMHRTREVLDDIFGSRSETVRADLVYDVCHNTAKLERHEIDGSEKKILIHRKGATRALPPGSSEIPERYRETGQPVLIGGSMETGSYLMAGTSGGREAFYTTVHGSGRVMSRKKARQTYQGREVQAHMKSRGIYVKTASFAGLAEEAGGAYKNVDEVVDASGKAGLGRIIAKLEPMGNIKG